MQSPQRAFENSSSFSMQNASPSDTQPTEENVWDIWPYCWAIGGWELAQERFHRFHTKRFIVKLMRYNRHARESFRARFWQNWNRERVAEDCELKLV